MWKKVCFDEYSIYYENKNGTWEGHFGSDSILFLKSQKVQWDTKASRENHVIQTPRVSLRSDFRTKTVDCGDIFEKVLIFDNPKFLKFCQFLFWSSRTDDSDFKCVCPGNFRQKLVKQNFSVIRDFLPWRHTKGLKTRHWPIEIGHFWFPDLSLGKSYL